MTVNNFMKNISDIILNKRKTKNMKRAFTLAEIMIVLVIIGALTAILLPSAFNSSPKENVIKFKKTNTNLMNVIRELVSNDRYYVGGDLGLMPGEDGGNLVTDLDDTDAKEYFCETLADFLSVKKKNCQTAGYTTDTYVTIVVDDAAVNKVNDVDAMKTKLDEVCLAAQEDITDGYEIISNDDVSWYQASPQVTFADKDGEGNRLFSSPFGTTPYRDEAGFDAHYKVLCIDVDGKDGKTEPFGYGIRADGKIISGAKADQWMEKSIQDKEDE